MRVEQLRLTVLRMIYMITAGNFFHLSGLWNCTCFSFFRFSRCCCFPGMNKSHLKPFALILGYQEWIQTGKFEHWSMTRWYTIKFINLQKLIKRPHMANRIIGWKDTTRKEMKKKKNKQTGNGKTDLRYYTRDGGDTLAEGIWAQPWDIDSWRWKLIWLEREAG